MINCCCRLTISVSNVATGALTDSLLVVDSHQYASEFTFATPGPIAAGSSGTLKVTLNTTHTGASYSYNELTFDTHDAVLPDEQLYNTSVPEVYGTVSQYANANVALGYGDGTLFGSGNSYVVNLGTIVLKVSNPSIDVAPFYSRITSNTGTVEYNNIAFLCRKRLTKPKSCFMAENDLLKVAA